MRYVMAGAISLVASLAQAGPIPSDFIDPDAGPARPKSELPSMPGLFSLTLNPEVVGSFFGPYQGPHEIETANRPRPMPPPPPPRPRPKPGPSGPKRFFPDPLPELIPLDQLIIPWVQVLADYQGTDRGPQPPVWAPFPMDYDFDAATITTEFGVELPLSITEIFSLGEIPSQITTSQGVSFTFDWDGFSEFMPTSEPHYFLVRRDIPLGQLFLPEPTSAMGLIALATLALLGRRAQRG